MVQIIAEITTNHFGNTGVLYGLVADAKRCGAGAVKVQVRKAEAVYNERVLALRAWDVVSRPVMEEFYGLNPDVDRELTFKEYREHLEIKDWEEFASVCKHHGVEWGVSVLDVESFRMVQQYPADFIKIPSTVSNNKQLYETVFVEWDGPLMVSVGMTDMGFVDEIKRLHGGNVDRPDMGFVNNVKRLHGGNIDRPVTIMQCTSCYPADDSDINLRVLDSFEGRGIIKGFSDHSRPGEVLAAQLAVGAGVEVIERHFRLPGVFVDKDVADTPEQFKNYVKAIRQAEIIMGSQQKTVLRCENHKYQYR